MTFLNSLFLLALPLIAVPVLLHFVRRREQQVIRWGAMRFLQQATTESRRMKLPESLLLLLARCLIVAGLVFALARPLLNWGGDSVSDRELIVIVDDTLSTSRLVDGGSVFHQIRDAAKQVIDGSPGSLPFQIMFASDASWLGRQPASAGSATGQTSLTQLAGHEPTLGSADLIACVQEAIHAGGERETSASPRPAQRIVVVTDGTTPGWFDGSQRTLERLRGTIEQQKLPIQIQVLDVNANPPPFNNLTVVQMKADRNRVRVKEKVSLRSEVRNTGTVASAACRLAWKRDGKVLGRSEVPPLEPGKSAEIVWSIRIDEPGAFAIVAQLQQKTPDDLRADSTATTVVEVLHRVPILLVDNGLAIIANKDSNQGLSQELTFLTSALGYLGEEPNDDQHSIFEPRIVSGEDAQAEDLSAYSAVLVLGADACSADFMELLLPEIRRGCGVWLMLDHDTNVGSFNEIWYQDGAGVSPLMLAPATDVKLADAARNTESEVDIYLHRPSQLHPATRVLADQQRVDLDEVTMEQHARFESLQADDDVSVLLRSNRGEPLVVENSIGRGRVMIQAFPMALSATNWPVTNSFVVTVYDWLDYLAQPTATTFNLNTGSPIVWRYGDRSDQPAWLTLPDGEAIELGKDASSRGIQNEAGTFSYYATQLPGTYQVRTSAMSDNPREMPFHIPPAREELLAKKLNAESRSWLEDVGGIELAASATDLSASAEKFWAQQRSVAGSRTKGQPVWHWIVPILVALLLAELLLAGRIGSRRGVATSSTKRQSDELNQSVGVKLVRDKPKSTLKPYARH